MTSEERRLVPGAPLRAGARLVDVKFCISDRFDGSPEDLLESARQFAIASRNSVDAPLDEPDEAPR